MNKTPTKGLDERTESSRSRVKTIGETVRPELRKRRRRSSSSTVSIPRSSIALRNDLLSSVNNVYLTDGLLQIYHDSFETHLSCWLTEKTCPYTADGDLSPPRSCGPDWNRIYHRVFKLDRSPSIRGRLLSVREERAASRALNLAILAFASQWAVRDTKHSVSYPFQASVNEKPLERSRTTSAMTNFDNQLQAEAWHQARLGLREAGDIESFRVVLAHIVFSLTQKPANSPEDGMAEEHTIEASGLEAGHESGNMEEFISMASKLDMTMNKDGPPYHLEQGLRLIHSLRSRIMLSGAIEGRRKKQPRCSKSMRPAGLDPLDRATVDVLFWLCIMFDTLSSAMHRRPLVISLEDSDLPIIRNAEKEVGFLEGATVASDPTSGRLWDDYLFSQQCKRNHGAITRWPCSEGQITSVLCEAAPVKVLLFRKITRIQTLMSAMHPLRRSKLQYKTH